MKPHHLLITTLTLATSALAQSNWPQWRGPNSDGTSSDATPPTTWSATKNVRWKTAIPGEGASSPVVYGDQIFVTSAIDTKKKGDLTPKDATAPTTRFQFFVYCIDRKSGDITWQKQVRETVPLTGHHEDHGYASASAITDGQHVWAHFGSRGTYCLTAGKGEQIWSREDLGEMETRGGFGDGSSPALYGDKLVIPWDHQGDSYITALDATTGKTIWKTDREHPTAWPTPLIIEHDGKHQIIQNGDGSAVSYDLETGKELWRADGQTMRPVSTPVVADGVAYIGSGFRGAFLAAYKLDGAKGNLTDTENVLWSIDKGTPDIASFLISNGRLYFHSGKDAILTCLDAKTGKPHYARERIPEMTQVYASPIAANGHIYLTGRQGIITVLKDADKLEIISTNDLEEPIDATPALVGKEIFVRSHKNLFCISE
jgi:outer membrane protein assembly factor BamB